MSDREQPAGADGHGGLVAAFNLSYTDLTPGQQRLFRRLRLHPGADIDVYAAAALDGTDLAAAIAGWRRCTTST